MAPVAAELAAAVLAKQHSLNRLHTSAVSSSPASATSPTPTATPTPTTQQPQQPISRPALQQVADSLARGISDVQYQLEAHISAHFDAFSQQAHNAVDVLKESRKLAESVEALCKRIEDPVDGLSSRLREAVREHKDVEREMEIVDLSLAVVQAVVEIQELFSTYDDRLAANDYPGALAVARQMGTAIRSLPSWQDSIPIFTKLLTHHSTIEADLANRLEYIISEALCMEFVSQHCVVLRVKDTVTAQGLGPQPISLRTALAAIAGQDVGREYLAPFVRMLWKRIVEPLVRDARWEVEVLEEEAGRALRVVFDEKAPAKWVAREEGLLLDRLETVLEFLESTLGFDDTAHVSYARPIFTLLGQMFWPTLADGIIRHYLEPAVPLEAHRLDSYASIAERSNAFEERGVGLGLVGVTTTSDRRLTTFCANLEHHFTDRRHHALLDTTRGFVTREKYATVEVEELQVGTLKQVLTGVDVNTSEGVAQSLGTSLPVECLEGLFAFPKCVVSVAARDLVELVRRTLRDAKGLSPYCKSQLQRSVHAILDLFRAIVPVHAATRLATIPQMPMVFHNDCMYIAHAMLMLNWEYRCSGTATRYLGLVVAYREMGEKVLREELKRQREHLKEIVDGAEGLDVLDDGRAQVVERALKQLSHQLLRLSRVWQPVFPPVMYRRTLTPLISHTLDLLSAQLTALVDIGSAESATLHALLSRFSNECVKPLLLEGGDTQQHNPSYERFVLLVRLLDASFAELMEVFRDGGMRGLMSEGEVVGIVRALFADTPLRRANLDEIGRVSAAGR
ncbi:Centromere/kinetochore protein zw10 [Geranomyces variabilis]|nr:Centromere/kinetochore protein zw10 [Geranomyces variabilis]